MQESRLVRLLVMIYQLQMADKTNKRIEFVYPV